MLEEKESRLTAAAAPYLDLQTLLIFVSTYIILPKVFTHPSK